MGRILACNYRAFVERNTLRVLSRDVLLLAVRKYAKRRRSIALPSTPLLLLLLPSSLPSTSSRSIIPLLVSTPPRSLLLVQLLRSPEPSTLPALLLHRVLLPLSSSKLSAERKQLLLRWSLRWCEALLLLVGEKARVEVPALDRDWSFGVGEGGGRGAAGDGGRAEALRRRRLKLLRVLRREVAELLLLVEARRRCEGGFEAAW